MSRGRAPFWPRKTHQWHPTNMHQPLTNPVQAFHTCRHKKKTEKKNGKKKETKRKRMRKKRESASYPCKHGSDTLTLSWTNPVQTYCICTHKGLVWDSTFVPLETRQ